MSKMWVTFDYSKRNEVGHIFKLGTKYSDSMGASFVDEDGENKSLIMGCYGIGLNRTMASIIEQHHDENGIIWPLAIAPYGVIIIPAVIKNEEQGRLAEDIYNKLKAKGIEVLLDDRNERTGVKFKDADLIGIPIRVTVGKRITEGKVEFKLRDNEAAEDVDIDIILDRIEKEYAKI